jgi:hypothetical protein
LPATNAPSIWARVPVPWATTLESIDDIVPATEDFRTGQLTGLPCAFVPSGSSIGLTLPSSLWPITLIPAGPGVGIPSRRRSTAPGLIVL